MKKRILFAAVMMSGMCLSAGTAAVLSGEIAWAEENAEKQDGEAVGDDAAKKEKTEEPEVVLTKIGEIADPEGKLDFDYDMICTRENDGTYTIYNQLGEPVETCGGMKKLDKDLYLFSTA